MSTEQLNAGSPPTGPAGGLAGAVHDDGAWPSATKGWWATFVFFILYSLSFVDRQMLNLLVEPIKHSLDATDFEISLLQGMTFAVFYTVFGLFIGGLVDTRPRRAIIFVGVVFWSVATAGCGLAVRYWQMAIARVGVAVGEASLAPAAYSLMSDLFPPKKLAMPMSVMGAGAPVGSALALLVGSIIIGIVPEGGVNVPLLGQLQGWQVAFLSVGIPGVLLAPLVFTFAEPVRRSVVVAGQSETVQTREVWSFLKGNRRFYLGHFLGFGIYSMVNYAVTAWTPTFFVRHHDFTIAEAGYAMGALILFVSMPGAILMGFLVDRWYASGRTDAHLRFFAIAFVIQTLATLGAFTASDPTIALALLIPQIALSGFTGVAAAALQITTPARMRGRVSAVYLLVFNLLGLGFGPSIVAALTDFVFRDEMLVGTSMIVTYLVFAPVGVLLMLWAAPEMRRKLASAPA